MNPEENKDSQQKPETPKEHESLDDLQERLYSRDEKSQILNEGQHDLSRHEVPVQETWSNEPPKPKMRAKHKTLVKKALIGASVFFLVAVSLAFFLIWRGFNLVSSDNIDIKVRGGTSIEAGKELSLDVLVSNNNGTALRDVKVTLEYPSGARDPEDVQKTLTRQEEIIERIEAHSSESKTFKSIIFGERNSVKDIIVSVQYKTVDSEAEFKKEIVYEIGIRSSPVTMTVSGPIEINSGQDLEYKISISSNSSDDIDDLMLIATYPLGFSFSSSDPVDNKDKRIWNLGTLEPREKKEIKIRGKIDGKENEEKTFNFALGIKSENSDDTLGIEFFSNRESVVIEKPFINLGVEINNSESQEYITQDDSEIKVSIDWENTLNTDLNDVSVEAKINGKILDELSVNPRDRGFYKSQSNTVVWNKNTNSEFSRVEPRKSGLLEFSFSPFRPDTQSVSQFKNNQIDIDITMKGTRFSDLQASEVVSAFVKRVVKIETDLSLAARAVYSIGPFNNTGPFPPKAETSTTYTVIWNISNNYNEVRDTVVTAVLPIYVDWVGVYSPQSELVSFDPETRKVIWNAGNILPSSGYTNPTKELAFQISLTPSLGQVGTSPMLINDSEIMGVDNFTNTKVGQVKPSLSTRIVSDPNYVLGKDKVVR